jgi:hypothetical protein
VPKYDPEGFYPTEAYNISCAWVYNVTFYNFSCYDGSEGGQHMKQVLGLQSFVVNTFPEDCTLVLKHVGVTKYEVCFTVCFILYYN